MKRLLLLIPVGLVGILLLGAYAYSIWPQRIPSKIQAVDTKSIDKNHAIGGTADNKTKDTSANNDSSASAPSNPPVAQNDVVPLEEVAPRQAEIRERTVIEYPYRALRSSNDPLSQPTWVLSTTKAQTAWDTSTGNGSVVAVIDSGFALTHEDLTNQWFQNVGETGLTASGGRCWTGVVVSKTTNNCDDDNNGYRDDWRGWDFVSVNNSPQAGETNPTGAGVAHGTQVAGLVGATGNNGIGTATMSWNNKIMPLQALGDDGSGYTSGVASAVYYAVDNGASVINMSLGGDTDDPTLAQAIKYAFDRNVVVVAAAGNCGSGNEQGCDPAKPGAMGYPALNPHVIAVGATTSTGARASFSSYGPGLDVVAPGSGTLVSPMWLSSNQTSAYATSLYGTSFASPIVASYIGLIKSIRPFSTSDDITALVNATSSKPAGMNGALFANQYGHGAIDTEAGLRVATGLNQTAGTPILKQAGDVLSEHTFSVGSTLASGCDHTAGAYCTIWAQNSLGYDRYLPYALTNASGQVGWSWTGGWLGDDSWSLKARSGVTPSTTPYQLTSK